jgi:hypothetical protein
MERCCVRARTARTTTKNNCAKICSIEIDFLAEFVRDLSAVKTDFVGTIFQFVKYYHYCNK